MKTSNDIFKDNLEQRLQSNNWDRDIAAKVYKKHNKTIRRYIFGGSFSAAVTAVVIIFAVTFIVNKTLVDRSRDTFITQQVEGTFSPVYTEKIDESKKNSDPVELIVQDDTDQILDEMLALR